MRRRAAIRNNLKGFAGSRANAVLAFGDNFRLLLCWLALLLHPDPLTLLTQPTPDAVPFLL